MEAAIAEKEAVLARAFAAKETEANEREEALLAEKDLSEREAKHALAEKDFEMAEREKAFAGASVSVSVSVMLF